MENVTAMLKVTLEFFTPSEQWDEQWAVTVLENAASREGITLGFHLCLSESLDEDGVTPCQECVALVRSKSLIRNGGE